MKFKRNRETEPIIVDGVEVPPMGALIPYDQIRDKSFHGIYCPSPEWIGIDESEFTDEQKAAISKQFQIPPAPVNNTEPAN